MDALETVVETHGLSKRYGGKTLAVDQLDLHVRRGEVYGFLGPNGAGKTTTLRLLVGLIRPSAGSATVLGLPPGHAESLRRIGCMVEEPAFYPYLSGRDNLRVVAHYCGVPEARISTALDRVDLLARADDKFGAYSTGMKQRLGVAAALLKDPELLILDEPTNGLDPQGMVEMREMIRGLGQEGRTVLLSSHLLAEVEHVCQRVGVIQGGHLIAEGQLQDLRGSAGLVLRATPEDQAERLLVQALGPDAVERRQGAFELAIDPGRSAEISGLLARSGVVVTELRPRERSLEEVFLRLTGTEPGEAAPVKEAVS
jgi:ABC-type multidrug transport system ATPase subunit